MSTGMAVQIQQTRQMHAQATPAHRTPAGVILARGLVFTGIAVAVACCPRFSHPAAMWLVALTMYAGFKGLTWIEYQANHSNTKLSTRRSLGYLFGWAGMDPTDFAPNRPAPLRPTLPDWACALATALAGFTLIGVAPLTSTSQWLVGACGLVGFLLAFHFGSFQLLALVWRRAGVNVPALMQHPEWSASLADFWGLRWNTAYRRLSFDYFFRPFVRRLGPGGALIVAFLISGLIHELVITWPARGGYVLSAAGIGDGLRAFSHRRPLGARRECAGESVRRRDCAAARPAAVSAAVPDARHRADDRRKLIAPMTGVA